MSTLIAYRIGKPPEGTRKPVIPPAPPKPRNDASRTLLRGSEDRCERPSLSVGPTVIGTGQHSAGRVSPKLVSLGTSATTLLIIAALFAFASGICGCGTRVDGQKEGREVYRDINKHIEELEIDGEKYIVVSGVNGVGICPKTTPVGLKPGGFWEGH